MSIPETIKQLKPTQFGAVEIRYISGHYYTYLVSSKWDPEKGRPQKLQEKALERLLNQMDLFRMLLVCGLCAKCVLHQMSHQR